jgi:hypothetical protein
MFTKYNFESRGLGMIATTEIPAKTQIGTYFTKGESVTDENRLIYDGWVESNPLGRYMNHNRNNNCDLYLSGDTINLVTNRDVRMHEELTVNYLHIIKAINIPEELVKKYDIRDFDYVEEIIDISKNNS